MTPRGAVDPVASRGVDRAGGPAPRGRGLSLARAGTALLALAIGWIALERWPHPFAWLGLIGFGGCLAFSRLGPRFVLDGKGGVRREGHFDDDGGGFFALRWPGLGRSHLLGRWLESFRPGPRDFELFHGIVAAARDTVEQQWPGAEFHVLLWNKPWKNDAEYWEGLERRGIRVHPISGILPNHPEDRKLYGIPNDGHPSLLANGHIARYVVREILGETPAPPAGAAARAAN